MDVENLQLIDRLHTMASEIACLKTTICEKEKQEEDLHRALEDGAVLEGSMQCEIEQQQVRAEELDLEIQSLQVYSRSLLVLSTLMRILLSLAKALRLEVVW